MVAVAFAYNKSETWALDRAYQADYHFEEGNRNDVITFITCSLNPNACKGDGSKKDEHSEGTPAPKGGGNALQSSASISGFWLIACIYLGLRYVLV